MQMMRWVVTFPNYNRRQGKWDLTMTLKKLKLETYGLLTLQYCVFYLFNYFVYFIYFYVLL